MITNNNFSLKKNNKGAALIVCIIILLFVSILATLILYMSGINYRMKKTDLNTRISFYSAETPLETMQSDLIVPISYAMNRGYRSTNSRYVTFASVDDRRMDFYNQFYDELEELLISQYGGSVIGADGSSLTDSTLVKNILHNLTYSSETDVTNGIPVDHIFCNDGSIVSDAGYTNNPIGFINALSSLGYFPDNYTDVPEIYLVVSSSLPSGTASSIYENFVELSVEDGSGALLDAKECRLVFRNVCVVVCQNGYRSIVSTDIAMQFPPLDWDGGMGTSDYSSWDIYQLLYYVNWQKS